MQTYYKICPECNRPANLTAASCAHCAHEFRTKFDGPPETEQTQAFLRAERSPAVRWIYAAGIAAALLGTFAVGRMITRPLEIGVFDVAKNPLRYDGERVRVWGLFRPADSYTVKPPSLSWIAQRVGSDLAEEKEILLANCSYALDAGDLVEIEGTYHSGNNVIDVNHAAVLERVTRERQQDLREPSERAVNEPHRPADHPNP